MQYSDFLNGYLKSGGWRFGGKPTSTETFQSLYTPEPYNGGLLDQVGNARKGPVTAAVSAAPVSTAVTTGLLSSDRGGGDNKGIQTDWGAILGDPSLTGKSYSELTTEQQNAASNKVDPYGIGKVISGVVQSTTLGSALKAFDSYMRGKLGNVTPDEVAAASRYGLSEDKFRGISKEAANYAADYAAGKGVNMGMSLADQYSQYGAGRVAAEQAVRDAGGGRDGGYKDGNAGSYDGPDRNGPTGDTGFAKGGMVRGLMGPDPEGPDDGYAALDKGEYVVKASAVKKLGKKTLDNINKGKLKKG